MTSENHHATVTVDQEASLASSAARLAHEFEGVFGLETINRFPHSSYAQLAETATVPNSLPLLTGRSQMALGFFQHYAGDNAVGWSGGSEPGDQVSPVAIEVMAERGIDISGEYPKPWTDEVVQAADVVITMGCGDTCPVFPGKRYEERSLSDSAGWNPGGVRPVRDEIEQMVIGLLEELDVPVSRTR